MEEFNLLVSLLEHESYRHYNINLAKNISINAAILYSNLTYLDKLFENSKDENDYFYTTSELIFDNTALTYDMQKTAMTKLKEVGLIDVVRKGMPSKNYFKIIKDVQLLKKLLTCSGNPVIKDRDSSNQGLGFSRSNNIIINNTKDINNNLSFNKLNDSGKPTPTPKNGTLFDIPSTNNNATSSASKTKKTNREVAEERVAAARQTGDWSKMTYRDFAYLFIIKYEEHYKLKLLDFDIYAASTIKKFMESYNIQKSHFEKVIDIMFERYENSKLKNEKFFTLTLNSLKQDFIVNELLLGYNGKSDALDRYERLAKEKIAQYEEEAKKMGITTATKTGEMF
jgi:hypothetical protein